MAQTFLKALVPAGLLILLLDAPIPALAQGSQPSGSSSVTPVEMANNQCPVGASPTTCGGAWSSTQTFMNRLFRGEIVTVAFAYLYGNSQNARLNFSDSLGNVPHLGASLCAVSAPIVCTAVGYFVVTRPGLDDVLFTETGGTTGEMWYNAEIWQGPFGSTVSAVGASSYCAQYCTGQVSIGPVSHSSTTSVIAISDYVAFYPNTPASWQFSYPYYYSATDFNPTGGDSVAWQGTTAPLQTFSFSATTSPVPNSWAGSGEVVFWS